MRLLLSLPVLLASLALASCGADAEPEVASTPEVQPADPSEASRELLDSIAPINQVEDGNLKNRCILAIVDELEDPGNLDFPVEIDMVPMSEGSSTYVSEGAFRYEDAQDIWRDGSYSCQVVTQNGSITDASAVAF